MKSIYIVILCLFLPINVTAKYYRTISINDGLPDNTVKCFAQDKLGFIWMGTFDGLCRYDGMTFRVYHNNPTDSNSILSNRVECLLSTDSLLWIGTLKGLNCLHYKTDCFDCCWLKENEKVRRMDDAIRSMIVVNGRLVVLTNEGQLCIQYKSRYFKQLCRKLGKGWNAIATFHKGEMLAIGNGRMVVLRVSDGKLISELLVPGTVSNGCLYYSRNQKKIFIGRGIGFPSLVVCENSQGNLELTNVEVPHDLKCVIDYGKQTLFGTDGGGLYTLEDGCYSVQTPKNSNLSSDAIHALFVDYDNNQWIGTYRGGVNLYSPNHIPFKRNTIENSGLSHNVITAFWRDGNLLYIGTDGGGLNVMNLTNGHVQYFMTGNSSLPGNHILSIVGDEDYIWMGVYGKGLCRYNKKKKDFITFDVGTALGNKSFNGIWQIGEHEGRIWMVGEGNSFYDKNTGCFEKMELPKRGYGLAFDGPVAWVASSFLGIYKLDAYSGKVLAYYNHNYLHNVSKTDEIRFIFVDSKHRIWFSTESSGFFRFSESTGQCESYGPKLGLMNSKVVSMIEGTDSVIWVGTFNGLYRFNSRYETFVCYGSRKNGALDLYNYNACYFDGDTIYYGGTQGLVRFPMQIKKNRDSVRPVCFTAVTMDHGEHPFIHLYGSHPQVVRLPYDENDITIHFSVLEMAEPTRIRMECCMKNVDDKWKPVEGRREMNYTNLSPGTYLFHVRCTTTDGQWNSDISELKIIITPPWWKTIWAQFLWVVLAVALSFVAFWLYLREINIRHMAHLKEVEDEAERNLNEEKLRFFTNIAHELRTPIFLITSPLEELIASGKRSVQVSSSYLNGIYRNALKLNKLITTIIDLRKLESGMLTLKLQSLNVVDYCSKLAKDYTALCAQKNINFYYVPSKSIIRLDVDVEKLELILSNLVSNAFKYSLEGCEVTLSVIETENNVTFSVKDNGIGIADENQQRIFDRFYQVDSDDQIVRGDGIGLSFVKKLLDLHQGHISVKSELGKGSEFIFDIPKQDNTQEDIKEEKHEMLYVDDAEKVDIAKSVVESPATVNTVLIIDDDIEILDMLANMLVNDYKILKTDDGMEGLKMLGIQLPDLIICDMMMPKMDGLTFLQKKSEDKKFSHIPVIMLTAKSSEEDRMAAFDRGASDYIQKPVSIKYLRHRISHILANRSSDDIYVMAQIGAAHSKEEQLFLLRCRELIEENLVNNDFDIQNMAEKLGMSHSSLYRKVKAITGLSVVEFINDYRIFKAIQFMKEGEVNINSICARCGFNDAKNFREVFKKKMKVTPKQFVKSL